MKNSVKLYICSFLLIFLSSGCVHYGVEVQINNDKSMNYSMNFELNKSYYNSYYSDGKSVISDEEMKSLKNNGFEVVETINSEIYSLTAKKSFDDIDDVSKENEKVIYNINNYADKYFFTVEKGLFKNKYTANVSLDLSNYIINEDNEYDNNYSLEYVVRLPDKSIYNNATKVSLDEKTLKWIAELGKVNTFEYSFELENDIVRIIKLILKVVIILVAIIIILLLIKKVKNKFYEGYWKYVKK